MVIKEGGQILWDSKGFRQGIPGVRGVEEKPGAFFINVGSGKYLFELEGE